MPRSANKQGNQAAAKHTKANKKSHGQQAKTTVKGGKRHIFDESDNDSDGSHETQDQLLTQHHKKARHDIDQADEMVEEGEDVMDELEVVEDDDETGSESSEKSDYISTVGPDTHR